MRVADILRAKGNDVVTVSANASVRDAIRQLGEHGIGALVVSDDGVTVEGIISERDVVRSIAATGGDALDTPVQQVMTSSVVTCSTDDGLRELAQLMTEGRFRHLPVVADDQLCGMVSIGDVVKRRLDSLETEREHLTNYIQGR